MQNTTRKSSSQIKDLVQISLMAAIIFVVTYLTQIPYKVSLVPDGVVHLGDSMVFVAAIIFGKKKGAIAAGIGMPLFDILSGYGIWSPITLVAKVGMALICGYIANGNNRDGKKLWANITGSILGGIWMIVIYQLGGMIITFLTTETSLWANFSANLLSAPGNVIQMIVGIIVAIPLAKLVEKSVSFKSISS